MNIKILKKYFKVQKIFQRGLLHIKSSEFIRSTVLQKSNETFQKLI